MKVVLLKTLRYKPGLKIAFKRLDKKDKNRVKRSPNLLDNPNFIASRILKKQVRSKRVCISHKDGFCVLACSAKNLGVDVEALKDRDFDKFAQICFTDTEKEFLKNSCEKKLDFYKIFTTKEALIKCRNLTFADFKKVSFFDKGFIKTHFLKDDFMITLVLSIR